MTSLCKHKGINSAHPHPWSYKGMVGQHHAPATLTRRKTWHPQYKTLGAPRGPTGRERKISLPPPLGFDSRNVQPATNRLNKPYASKRAERLINTSECACTVYCIKPCKEGGSVVMYNYVRSRHETERWPRTCGKTIPQSAVFPTPTARSAYVP
jgi:hypothetical protein